MTAYTPPRLKEKIRIRNPADEPARQRDPVTGAPTDAEPTWGVEVYANRRDQAPFTEIVEGVQVRAGRTIFTIRHRDDLRADDEIVDSGGIVYVFDGVPVERGGQNGRMRAKYLEIYCERRQAE